MGRTFTIRRVDKDLRAVVICTENSSETKPDLSDDGIAQAVLDAGVNFGLFENYASIIRDACLDGTAKESQVVIAEALLPVDGQDGFIELQYNNILSPGRIDSESDKIDYKERQLFVICEENDILAKVFPSTKGRSGTNVAGDKLMAKDGSEFPLRLGECVRSEQCPGHLAVYARQNGIIFYDGKSLIDVVRYQCINGDVDYSTGNLSIEGSLRITGWVREGFSVKATGSVIVEGGVEDALVEAGEDMVIHAGIVARGNSICSAQGSITAKFIEGARVTAKNDIIVRDFISRGHVKSGGKVVVLEGRGQIMGGTVSAVLGQKMKVLGNQAGLFTELHCGLDEGVLDEMRTLKSQLNLFDRNERKIRSMLKTGVRDIKSGIASREYSAKLSKLAKFHRDSRLKREKLRRLKALLSKQEKIIKKQKPMICVEEKVFENVSVIINGQALQSHEASRSKFYYDEGNSKVLMSHY